MKALSFATPIGDLTAYEKKGALTALRFGKGEEGEETPLLQECRRQLAEYFAGQRKTFSLPIHLEGTDFQKRVWQALRQIPYGETWSYQRLAQQVGRPGACRAVGMAIHHNPLPIILPCHRVIGKNGSLTGYAGGLEKKEFLLALEGQKNESGAIPNSLESKK